MNPPLGKCQNDVMKFSTSKSETRRTLEGTLLRLIRGVSSPKVIRFWNGAGRQHQTLLSRCTDLFQADDPNNPQHIFLGSNGPGTGRMEETVQSLQGEKCPTLKIITDNILVYPITSYKL